MKREVDWIDSSWRSRITDSYFDDFRLIKCAFEVFGYGLVILADSCLSSLRLATDRSGFEFFIVGMEDLHCFSSFL